MKGFAPGLAFKQWRNATRQLGKAISELIFYVLDCNYICNTYVYACIYDILCGKE